MSRQKGAISPNNITTPMHTIIIAEAGVNHNGDIQTAIRLIDAAAEAGADYVKFQTFKAEELVIESAPRAQYQAQACPEAIDNSQLSMLKKLELTFENFAELAEYCNKRNIGFMSTPFDLASIEFLASLGMDYWKIPSGEITDLPYLRAIAARHGKVIMSTGMSSLAEVEAALNVLEASGKSRRDIILLHCTTQYPAPLESVNLRAMDTLATLGCAAVGYSDHTRGITVPIAAAARGAHVIEKHFTLSRQMEGPDHKASLEPSELTDMVRAIRNVETALGAPEKAVTAAEKANIAIARRSIVAARHIVKGHTITAEDITTKRPGTGLSPMLWDEVIGSKASRDYNTNELIELS